MSDAHLSGNEADQEASHQSRKSAKQGQTQQPDAVQQDFIGMMPVQVPTLTKKVTIEVTTPVVQQDSLVAEPAKRTRPAKRETNNDTRAIEANDAEPSSSASAVTSRDGEKPRIRADHFQTMLDSAAADLAELKADIKPESTGSIESGDPDDLAAPAQSSTPSSTRPSAESSVERGGSDVGNGQHTDADHPEGDMVTRSESTASAMSKIAEQARPTAESSSVTAESVLAEHDACIISDADLFDIERTINQRVQRMLDRSLDKTVDDMQVVLKTQLQQRVQALLPGMISRAVRDELAKLRDK